MKTRIYLIRMAHNLSYFLSDAGFYAAAVKADEIVEILRTQEPKRVRERAGSSPAREED